MQTLLNITDLGHSIHGSTLSTNSARQFQTFREQGKIMRWSLLLSEVLQPNNQRCLGFHPDKLNLRQRCDPTNLTRALSHCTSQTFSNSLWQIKQRKYRTSTNLLINNKQAEYKESYTNVKCAMLIADVIVNISLSRLIINCASFVYFRIFAKCWT